MSSFRLVVLISGGGTTLKNLLTWKTDGRLNAEIVHVISSRADAGGVVFAEAANVAVTVIDSRRSGTLAQFSHSIFEVCRSAQADLVVMGGFLRRVLIPPDFENRVVNIHPSLIPAFCGKGMYGERVHQAVLNYGCKITGCTVHFVDNEYDHGPIIAQQSVPVYIEDLPETLAHRVFDAECQLYPKVINAISNGDVEVNDRHVHAIFR